MPRRRTSRRPRRRTSRSLRANASSTPEQFEQIHGKLSEISELLGAVDCAKPPDFELARVVMEGLPDTAKDRADWFIKELETVKRKPNPGSFSAQVQLDFEQVLYRLAWVHGAVSKFMDDVDNDDVIRGTNAVYKNIARVVAAYTDFVLQYRVS